MTAVPWRPIGSYVEQAVAEVKLRTEYPDMQGLSTGISGLDAGLGPVLDGGRVLVVAAPTGFGKTVTAAQFATAFAAQTRVLFWTMEDDPVDVSRRPLAALSGVGVGALRTGFREGTIPAAVGTAAAALAELPIDMMDRQTDVITLGTTAAEWARSGDGTSDMPCVLIIDQLSHILHVEMPAADRRKFIAAGFPAPPRYGSPDHVHFEWIVEVLSYLAKRHNILVALMHQLNQRRDEVDGKPTVESLRSSQGIGHKADAVLLLHRPKRVPNPAAEFSRAEPRTLDNTTGRTWFIGDKVRAAAQFEVEVRWYAAGQRFADLSDNSATMRLPAQPNERALEGRKKLAELRARMQAERAALAHEADGNQHGQTEQLAIEAPRTDVA